MKRIICVLVALCLLVGCSAADAYEKPQQQYITGVWLSFSELDQMLGGDFKAEFKKAVQQSKDRGITDMFVHVRPYCDAIYPSSIFPMREGAKALKYDALAYMIDVCHKNGIRLHAWINPYRVRTADGEVNNLPADSPASRWLHDDKAENDANVLVYNGIYLDPSSSDVKRLVLDGVKEIINNYSVDGVHLDDYFYPTTDEFFDNVAYTNYSNNVDIPMSLADWRRSNVNALISSIYTAVKFKDKDIVFSVSPSASIEENYNKHYADAASWIKSDCVDYIIPQLYFGFDYPDEEYRFDALLNKWIELTADSNTRLLIGLAAYKINTPQEPDKQEWAKGAEVISKQVTACKEHSEITGHIYFSYSSMVEYIK